MYNALKSCRTMFAFLVPVLIILFGGSCSKNKCMVEGKYVAFPEINLKYVEVEFTLFDKENMTPVNRYRTKLNRDGSFSIRVKERGEYLLMLSGGDHLSFTLKEPVFSNDMVPYFYNFQDGEVIKLEGLYISDAIKIISPETGKVYTELNGLVFEWPDIPFADFYDLDIFRISQDGEEEIVISVHGIRNRVRYESIKALKLVEKKKIDFDTWVALGSFNRRFSGLTPGKYGIVVYAYKLLPARRDLLLVGQTSTLRKTYFFVE